ncbi:hypothetical protein D3C77_445560 [compost metagenome]
MSRRLLLAIAVHRQTPPADESGQLLLALHRFQRFPPPAAAPPAEFRQTSAPLAPFDAEYDRNRVTPQRYGFHLQSPWTNDGIEQYCQTNAH